MVPATCLTHSTVSMTQHLPPAPSVTTTVCARPQAKWRTLVECGLSKGRSICTGSMMKSSTRPEKKKWDFQAAWSNLVGHCQNQQIGSWSLTSCQPDRVKISGKRLALVGALSPVNLKGLYQGWKQILMYLLVIHFTSLFFSNHNSDHSYNFWT